MNGSGHPWAVASVRTVKGRSALGPIVSLIDAEFDHAVLPSAMHLQIDMPWQLSGSYSPGVGVICGAATQSGVETPNGGRRSADLPALEGLDTLRTGNAPSWPADANGMPFFGPSPGRTRSGVPQPGNQTNEGAAT
jgi:hypothetical protein